MKRTSVLLLAGVVALAGCGEDDDTGSSRDPAAGGGGATEKAKPATPGDDRAQTKGAAGTARAGGTTITAGDSEFGTMLFDSKQQAIYIFERDRDRQTVCYGDCAEAWPPVLTSGKPKAGKGVRKSLLGTVRRRDGKEQVTYAGKPLYFYAHERPGEVRCHNVNLNGGLWWVLGPDGRRRP